MLAPQTQTLVDRQGFGSSDYASVVGRIGLMTRIVSALPTDGKPPQPTFLPVGHIDNEGMRLADPTDGSVVGEPALFVHRLLAATRTWNTRGL